MDTPDIKPLTPQIAKDYLKFKAQETPKIVKKNTVAEDPKRFLSYREELVPRYFTEEWFCKMINDLRRKIWKNKEREKKLWVAKSTAFQDALYEVVLSKTQNTWDDIGSIKSLIGILLHVFRDVKYKEHIEQSEAEILDNFITNPKEDQFEVIFQDLKDMYFFDQELGGETNSSENGDFFDQAWKVFETQEIKSMPQEERNKLHAYLYERYGK